MTFEIKISGKVQGVWFRASAKDQAISLGLKGKAWNEPDGRVGIIVQGDRTQIDSFIEWCKEGPPLARVHEVQGVELQTNQVYHGFEIARHA